MVWLGINIIFASIIIYAGLQNAVEILNNKNKK